MTAISRYIERHFAPRYATVGEFLDSTLPTEDTSPFEACLERERTALLIVVMSACLRKRERDIVRMRWGLHGYREHTFAAIARHYGISSERTRQIERKACRTIERTLLHWAATGGLA